jgi:hypothetical protein
LNNAVSTTEPVNPLTAHPHMVQAVALIRRLVRGDILDDDDGDFLRSLTLTELDLAFCDRGVSDHMRIKGATEWVLVPLTAAALFLALHIRPPVGEADVPLNMLLPDGTVLGVSVARTRTETLP